jgi:release factor glutamine methyltransferase
MTPAGEQFVREAIGRRLEGEPLAYILQTQGFYKYEFFVDKRVLVPRPETEIIVDEALIRFAKQPPTRFVDLGCGSGCIGLSLLKEWPQAKLTAVDLSRSAIAVSEENARRLGVSNRVEFLCSDVEKLSDIGAFDLVVANPPYIDKSDSNVEANVRRYEPNEALFAADDGYAKLFAWSHWAFQALKRDGWWILEIGAGQKEKVEAKLFEIGFHDIKIKKDLAGHWRTAVARKP